MNIENPISSASRYAASYVGGATGLEKAENLDRTNAATLAGPGVSFTGVVQNAETIGVTDEIERDLVRDDPLGRAVNAALNYAPPTLDFSSPDFMV